MRFVIAIASLLVMTALGRADEPKKAKTVEELYPSFKGEWGTRDPEAKVKRLQFIQIGKYDKKPDNFPTEWHVGLLFEVNDKKGYYGAAEKVEVQGETLKYTLPPTGKDDDKRTTRTFTIKRAEKKLEVELLDGEFKGKYVLENADDQRKKDK